jgi:GntR family transcriptional regulator, vanillate catabolism transcriptional regulator
MRKQRVVTKPPKTDRVHGVLVVERLRTALLERQLRPGSRVKEEELTERFGVSRTPIRAALQSLAGEGLLIYAPHKGYTVRDFPLSEIVDAYEMRVLAEGLAARRSAERGLSDSERDRIIGLLAEGDQILKNSSKLNQKRAAFGQVNHAFHTIIKEASGSRIVNDVIRLCQQIPQTDAGNVMAFDLDEGRRRHQDHHQIYAAIICREPKEAESLMRAHVARVKTSIIRQFADSSQKSSRVTRVVREIGPSEPMP